MMITRMSYNRVLVGEEVAASNSCAVTSGGDQASSPLSDWIRSEGLRGLCEQLRVAKAKKRKEAIKSLYKQIKSWMFGVSYWDIPDLCFVQMVHEPYVHCGSCNNIMTYSSKAEVIFYGQ